MNTIDINYWKTPFGELILGSYSNQLCLCDWRYRKMRSRIDTRICTDLNAEYVEHDNDLINETKKQLTEYFQHQRKTFALPLLPIGTEFQQAVWNQLLQIPFGSTTSYAQLAEQLGDTRKVRAVATANGANAISIIIPCHRVIGSNGQLTGYAGGLRTKERLLNLECDLFNQN